MRALASCFLAVGALAPGLTGQEIMTLEGAQIRWLSPKDGSVIRTGWALGARGTWYGLARDSQGLLVGASGQFHPLANEPYGIYSIDPLTGGTLLVVQTSLFGITAIAFGPGDLLYALHDPSYGQGALIDLIRIDLLTGASTLVGNTGITLSDTLTYGDGFLWTYHGGEFGLGLMRIDPLTGMATDVNPGLRGPNDLVDSLTFSDDGVLYLIDYGLWIVDTVTGVPVFVNFIPGFPLFYCAEFVPGLAEPFSLGLRGESGHLMGAFVAGATPGGRVALLHGYGYGGPTTIPGGSPCAGGWLDLRSPVRLVSVLTAGLDGKAEVGPVFVPAQVRGRVRLQALDLATCATSNVARVVF